jgi:hypothetical protein
LRRPVLAALATAATLAGSALIPDPADAQQTPARYEEGFFDLVLPRIGRTVGVGTLVDSARNVLIPLRPVLELTGVSATWTADSVVLQWPPGEWRTVLRPAARQVESAGERRLFASSDWALATGELFLSAGVLTSVLDVPVEVSFADLTVTIAPDSRLPALRRLDIAQRRRIDSRGDAGGPTPVSVPYPPRTGGFAASWGFSAIESPTGTRGSMRAASGVSAWGGALEGGGTFAFGDDIATTLDDGFARWSRAFPENRWVSQVQTGTVFAEGPAGRRVIGFSITNSPWTSPRFFDEAVIGPAVPAGWEYEVYQGDYLVGVGSREDPAGVRTPINYGHNPLRIRLLGPSGQEEIQDLVLVVRPDMAATGALRYAAGGGACADPACEDYAWADVRYGISRRLTAGVGADRITLERTGSRIRPWFTAIGTPLENLAAELQVQPDALVRSMLQLNTARSGAYGASYAWFRPAGDVTVLSGWIGTFNSSTPIAVFGNRYLSTRLQMRGADADRLDIWQASIASTIRRIHTAIEYESGLQARDIISLRTFTSWPSPGLGAIRDLSLSATLGASREGAELVEIAASARPRPSTSLNAGLRLRRDSPPAFIIGLSARLDAAYAQTRATHAAGGASLFVAADGGIAVDAFNPSLGYLTLPFESLGRAGIGGTVYHDVDGNGRLDAGEPALAGTAVTVGSESLTTNRDGTYRTWLIQPYDAIAVTADSLSLPFDMAPARPARLVRPSPNIFTRIDIGVVRTREVTGSIRHDDPTRPVGGIGVEILSPDGELVATARTFQDGEFYVPRLRPGTWFARVAATSLAALGAFTEFESVEFVVPVGGTEVVRVAEITLR